MIRAVADRPDPAVFVLWNYAQKKLPLIDEAAHRGEGRDRRPSPRRSSAPAPSRRSTRRSPGRATSRSTGGFRTSADPGPEAARAGCGRPVRAVTGAAQWCPGAPEPHCQCVRLASEGTATSLEDAVAEQQEQAAPDAMMTRIGQVVMLHHGGDREEARGVSWICGGDRRGRRPPAPLHPGALPGGHAGRPRGRVPPGPAGVVGGRGRTDGDVAERPPVGRGARVLPVAAPEPRGRLCETRPLRSCRSDLRHARARGGSPRERPLRGRRTRGDRPSGS